MATTMLLRALDLLAMLIWASLFCWLSIKGADLAAALRWPRDRSVCMWAVNPGSAETGPGLYRIEVACGPGGGVKILNQPTPPIFRESVRVGEQNLYTRAKEWRFGMPPPRADYRRLWRSRSASVANWNESKACLRRADC
jgi:hypothetical protein